MNHGSLILTAAMMLDTIGFTEADNLIRKGVAGAIEQKTVTYDLERLMEWVTTVSTSEFDEKIIVNM